VFVEKPLAGTLADARIIAEAADRTDRVVQVGFCERFNVNYLEAKRAASDGSLGRIRAIHTSRVAPYAMSNPAWELGVLDTAVHNLDLIVWLIGQLPASVLARAVRIYPDSAIPHSATILLNFDDGAMAVDHVAWLKDGGYPLNQCARSRMLIHGDEGIFDVDLTDRPASLLNRHGFRKIDSVIIGAPEYAGCLKLQFEYFLRSVEEGARVLAPVAGAVATERVALAALESLRSGREVKLDAAD
jgi:myo-inositol 2-dehydrogenase/D-chiro-inositol 1-dehydrogenase